MIGPLERLEAAVAAPTELGRHASVPQLAARARRQVQDIVAGIRPSELDGGLRSAIRLAVARSPVPVALDLDDVRLDAGDETALYFVACEALANLARHADATVARLTLSAIEDRVRLVVEDDGVGGAEPSAGSGLEGLAMRVSARGGRLTLDSPRGGGTRLVAEVPVHAATAEAGRSEAESARA